MLPVATGQAVRVLVPIRVVGREVVRGLLLWAVDPTGRTEGFRLVAVLDVASVVAPDLLPRALADIRPLESLVYQTAYRDQDECAVAVSHQHFAVGSGADDGTGAGLAPGLAVPGARVERQLGGEVWDLILLDNRRTLRTSCPPEPAPYWAWVAIRRPDAAGTDPAVPAGSDRAAPAPAERTPPGAPRGKFPPRPRR